MMLIALPTEVYLNLLTSLGLGSTEVVENLDIEHFVLRTTFNANNLIVVAPQTEVDLIPSDWSN